MANPTATSTGLLPGTATLEADAQAFGDRRDPWNRVVLGGIVLPGRAEVSGTGLEHLLDVKKAPGKRGVTITDLGRDVGKYEIKLVLWGDDQWKEARDLRKTLQPLTKDKKLQALDIQHIALNWLGVNSVYVYKIGVPQPGTAMGTIEIALSCLEYTKQSGDDVTNTVLGSKTITAKNDVNAANFTTGEGTRARREPKRVADTRPSTTGSSDVAPPANFTPANYTPG